MPGLTLQPSPSMARSASISGFGSGTRRDVWALAMALLRCLGHGWLAAAAPARGLYDKAIAGLHVDLVGAAELDLGPIHPFDVVPTQGALGSAFQPVGRN